MIRRIGAAPRRGFVRQYMLERGSTVEVFVYPFGASRDGGAVISSVFSRESDIDLWIAALKAELDDAACDAKRALRKGQLERARGPGKTSI